MLAPEAEGDGARRPALEERPGLVKRVAGRLAGIVEPLVARVLGVPRIGMAHAVYTRFGASSGPVLARGLAYAALFALVPALLVIVSVAGWFVSDPAVRAEIVAIVAEQFPPLGPVIDEVLAGFSGVATTTGIVGVVLLVWSASSLVRALDGAFRVVFGDSGEGRTPVRDVVAVAAVAGGTFAAALVVVIVTLPGPIGDVLGVPSAVERSGGSLVVTIGLVAVAFRFVPRPRPGWRMLWLPALCTGGAIFLLTSFFALLGPLLFGSAELYGAFGSLFLGLIWLENVTQLILLGAAWVAERGVRSRARSAEAGAGEPPGI